MLWALVLSGVVPSFADVLTFPTQTQFLWSISAPRWAIEAFWIREMAHRPWIEKLQVNQKNGYTNSEAQYATDLKNFFLIGVFFYHL